jgi:hypothetical protein
MKIICRILYFYDPNNDDKIDNKKVLINTKIHHININII